MSEIRFAHPIVPSAQRVRGLRLYTAAVPAAAAVLVTPGAAWLSGDDIPADAWVEVRTSRGGPAFVGLREVADGPSSLALTIRLDETRPVDGVAVGGGDQLANGALITLFRLIDPADASLARTGVREKPRRVLTAEAIADARGAFHIDGAGEAEYEVVAWHPQLGRASLVLPRQPGVLTIRLESPGTVRGRVIVAGKPRPGVDVISLPAPEAYKEIEDFVDLKGGDARTGADGRFAVMAAAGGGGELRVGGGPLPIRRIPLPRVPAPLLDLGDIELDPRYIHDRARSGHGLRRPRDRSHRAERPADCARRPGGAGPVPDRASGARPLGLRRNLRTRRIRALAANAPDYAGTRRQGGAFFRSLTALTYGWSPLK